MFVLYDFDQLGRVTRIRENGASSGIGVLAAYSYTPTGQRALVTYGNGTTRSYAYDPAGRTTGVRIDLAGTASDLTIGQVAGTGSPVAYNPAGQIVSLSRSNDAYAWTAHSLFERDYAVNGLNQYTSAGGVTLGYDGRGNLTASGPSTFGYSRLNELTSAPNGTGGTVQMTYDPKGRLTLYNPGTPLGMVYAGPNLVTETNPTGTILRRYVHGPGVDEPLVWYEGSGTADRRFLQADQLGSVAAISNASGTMLAINRYDEYGIPQAGNTGRFAYTGQTWFGEVGLYNYKARWYSPTLGRFMQTDPIGYKDNVNLYAYVGNDPVNRRDPTGKSCVNVGTKEEPKFSCRVDDRRSFLEAGFRPGQISRMEKAYTDAANKLLEDPSKVRTVSFGGQSFQVTQGNMAAALAVTYVKYGPTVQYSATSGGEMDSSAVKQDPLQRSYTRGWSFTMQIGDYAKGASEKDLRLNFLHEPIHTQRGEGIFRSVEGAFRAGHDAEYDRVAREIDEE